MSIKFVRLAFEGIQIAYNCVIVFHPLEIVGYGSETQLEVGENLSIVM